MRNYNPYRNIYYYYRGPSTRLETLTSKQIEDNTTKALINTLEFTDRKLLSNFLELADIYLLLNDVSFDLQIAKDSSRPDAAISIKTKNVYIENKVECCLDKDQIKKHLKNIANDYLIYISPRPEDKILLQGIIRPNLKILTWNQIYTSFQSCLKTMTCIKSRFLIQQFLAYLEALEVKNMAPFIGWNKNQFETFINIEDDHERKLRLRVKKDMEQFLDELQDRVSADPILRPLVNHVGKIEKGSDACWGVLWDSDKKIHLPHFNFVINADEFAISIQIEGKNPAHRFRRYVIENQNRFCSVLRRLEGFDTKFLVSFRYAF
jgi:hypothetical protein